MAYRDVLYNQCISNTWKFSIFIFFTGRIKVCEIRFASTSVIFEKPYPVCKKTPLHTTRLGSLYFLVFCAHGAQFGILLTFIWGSLIRRIGRLAYRTWTLQLVLFCKKMTTSLTLSHPQAIIIGCCKQHRSRWDGSMSRLIWIYAVWHSVF